MEALFSPEALISLLTLTIMEVVLGIDNLVFVSIVSSRLPKEQQKKSPTNRAYYCHGAAYCLIVWHWLAN